MIKSNHAKMETILDLVTNRNYVYSPDDQQLFNNERFVYLAVKRNPFILRFVSEELKNNKKIVLRAVKNRGLSLEHCSTYFQNDEEVVTAAVKQNGCALQFASEELKNNYYIVEAAVRQQGNALMYVSDKIKKDKRMAMRARNRNKQVLSFILKPFLDDVDFCIELIGKDGYYTGEKELLANKNFIIKVIEKICPYSIIHASPELLSDIEVANAAIKKGFNCLGYLSIELRDNYEIVSSALKINSDHFMHISERLRNNR